MAKPEFSKKVILKLDGEYVEPSISIASQDRLGAVKVDGTSITVDNEGVLSASATKIDVDNKLDPASTNPVQNKVITQALSTVPKIQTLTGNVLHSQYFDLYGNIRPDSGVVSITSQNLTDYITIKPDLINNDVIQLSYRYRYTVTAGKYQYKQVLLTCTDEGIDGDENVGQVRTIESYPVAACLPRVEAWDNWWEAWYPENQGSYGQKPAKNAWIYVTVTLNKVSGDCIFNAQSEEGTEYITLELSGNTNRGENSEFVNWKIGIDAYNFIENELEGTDFEVDIESICLTQGDRERYLVDATFTEGKGIPISTLTVPNEVVERDQATISIANEDTFGLVKPDGTSITIDDGVISANVSQLPIDDHLDDESTNPVQNKIIKEALDSKTQAFTNLPIYSEFFDLVGDLKIDLQNQVTIPVGSTDQYLKINLHNCDYDLIKLNFRVCWTAEAKTLVSLCQPYINLESESADANAYLPGIIATPHTIDVRYPVKHSIENAIPVDTWVSFAITLNKSEGTSYIEIVDDEGTEYYNGDLGFYNVTRNSENPVYWCIGRSVSRFENPEIKLDLESVQLILDDESSPISLICPSFIGRLRVPKEIVSESELDLAELRIANEDTFGLVKPDGDSIKVDEGVISVAVDSELSDESEKPVQNKVIADALAEKQDQIDDLDEIRAGAQAGATAVQPEAIENMQTVDNKVTELTEESTDEQYPSAKAVYDAIENTQYELPIATQESIGGVKVDGTSITINNEGTITAVGGGGTGISIDTEVTEGSENPVQNGAIYNALSVKQDIIEDLDKIRSNAEDGAQALVEKQDIIEDLDDIRAGAEAGTQALAEKQDQIEDLDEIRAGAQAGIRALVEKQDLIEDLDEIRAGAQAGATAVQPGDFSDFQLKSNMVTQITKNSTNSKYPSAKAVYNAIDDAAYELPIATTLDLGGVKPDGRTITIDADGSITAVCNKSQILATTADNTSGIFTLLGDIEPDINKVVTIPASDYEAGIQISMGKVRFNTINLTWRQKWTTVDDRAKQILVSTDKSYLPAIDAYSAFDFYYPEKIAEIGTRPSTNWTRFTINLNKVTGNFTFTAVDEYLGRTLVELNSSTYKNTNTDALTKIYWTILSSTKVGSINYPGPETQVDLNSLKLTLDGTVYTYTTPNRPINEFVIPSELAIDSEARLEIATTDQIGLVKPDGTTIRIKSDGTITAIGGGGGGSIDVDDHLDSESVNPVENRVITSEIDNIHENIENVRNDIENIRYEKPDIITPFRYNRPDSGEPMFVVGDVEPDEYSGLHLPAGIRNSENFVVIDLGNCDYNTIELWWSQAWYDNYNTTIPVITSRVGSYTSGSLGAGSNYVPSISATNAGFTIAYPDTIENIGTKPDTFVTYYRIYINKSEGISEFEIRNAENGNLLYLGDPGFNNTNRDSNDTIYWLIGATTNNVSCPRTYIDLYSMHMLVDGRLFKVAYDNTVHKLVVPKQIYDGYNAFLDVAKSDQIGLVKPDNRTVTVAEDGTISAIGGGGSIEVDDYLDHNSVNPVQNKVITFALDAKGNSTIEKLKLNEEAFDEEYYGFHGNVRPTKSMKYIIPEIAGNSIDSSESNFFYSKILPEDFNCNSISYGLFIRYKSNQKYAPINISSACFDLNSDTSDAFAFLPILEQDDSKLHIRFNGIDAELDRIPANTMVRIFVDLRKNENILYVDCYKDEQYDGDEYSQSTTIDVSEYAPYEIPDRPVYLCFGKPSRDIDLNPEILLDLDRVSRNIDYSTPAVLSVENLDVLRISTDLMNYGLCSLLAADADTYGVVKPDNKTVFANNGILSAVGGGGSIDVDDHMDLDSENPVQNKVITAEINNKVEVQRNSKFSLLGNYTINGSIVTFNSDVVGDSAIKIDMGTVSYNTIKLTWKQKWTTADNGAKPILRVQDIVDNVIVSEPRNYVPSILAYAGFDFWYPDKQANVGTRPDTNWTKFTIELNKVTGATHYTVIDEETQAVLYNGNGNINRDRDSEDQISWYISNFNIDSEAYPGELHKGPETQIDLESLVLTLDGIEYYGIDYTDSDTAKITQVLVPSQIVTNDTAIINVAKTNVLGLVKPDGSTIKVRDDGTIYSEGGGGGTIEVDDRLSTTSENPVQNKVITEAIKAKQDISKLTTVISEESTDSQYPSAKAVYEAIMSMDVTIPIDAGMSSTSENPVQNRVVKLELDKKQNTIPDIETIRANANEVIPTKAKIGDLNNLYTEAQANLVEAINEVQLKFEAIKALDLEVVSDTDGRLVLGINPQVTGELETALRNIVDGNNPISVAELRDVEDTLREID